MADSTSHCKLMLHKIGSGFWLDIQVLGNIGHPRYIISYQLAEVLNGFAGDWSDADLGGVGW
jgi:hypothetical protein